MKFMFSVVQYWAAQIKSPSFSLSGSSVTMMMCPACNSSIASSTVLNFLFSFATIKPPEYDKALTVCSAASGLFGQHNTSCAAAASSYLLPSRLYCRFWNCTKSRAHGSYAVAFADYTADREFHPALKIYDYMNHYTQNGYPWQEPPRPAGMGQAYSMSKILPGLRILLGSKAFFMAFIMASSSGLVNSSIKCLRLKPMPCSPDKRPPWA